jgi:hypothetical protein
MCYTSPEHRKLIARPLYVMGVTMGDGGLEIFQKMETEDV